MSQQNERDPKDRGSDDLIPDGGQEGDDDRAGVIRPPRPAEIPPGSFPPPVPAPHHAPPPFPAPQDAPALGGDNILDPD